MVMSGDEVRQPTRWLYFSDRCRPELFGVSLRTSARVLLSPGFLLPLAGFSSFQVCLPALSEGPLSCPESPTAHPPGRSLVTSCVPQKLWKACFLEPVPRNCVTG